MTISLRWLVHTLIFHTLITVYVSCMWMSLHTLIPHTLITVYGSCTWLTCMCTAPYHFPKKVPEKPSVNHMGSSDEPPKKVLLRECKRHTARRVASPGGGGTYLGRGGTYLSWGVPTLARGYLPWHGGTYLDGGATYLGWGVPTTYFGRQWGTSPQVWTDWKQPPVVLRTRVVMKHDSFILTQLLSRKTSKVCTVLSETLCWRAYDLW